MGGLQGQCPLEICLLTGLTKVCASYMCESGDYNYGMSFVSRVWQADADQRDHTEGQNIL